MNTKDYDENIALISDDGASLTYGSLKQKGSMLAEQIGGRCLVFIMASNTIGSVLGYSAFLNNRIVPAMLNRSIDRDFFDSLLESYRPKFIWAPTEEKDGMRECTEVYSDQGYSLFRTKYNDEYRIYEDLALLLTTSGSTGSPKFVRQSYSNILANTKSIVEYLEIDSNERPITTLPMNYTYGLSIINSHLYSGATILLTEKTLMQKEFWSFFNSEGATSFGGVPYTYEMLDKLRFYRMDLSTLRTMTQAGGKLSPDLHEKFAKYAAEADKKFVVMYGQCEATARMGYLPAIKAIEKKGSMGIAIPGGEFSLIDENEEIIDKPFTAGELVYKGKNVTLGYAENCADLQKGDERLGVLKTGDMAQFDNDGYYYIVGRKKRFLKIFGNRVNLDEMDRVIASKFETEVACAGKDDHMYIFITDQAMCDEVKKYVSTVTKLNPVAFNVIAIPAIPRNDSGKVRYVELEKYYDI